MRVDTPVFVPAAPIAQPLLAGAGQVWLAREVLASTHQRWRDDGGPASGASLEARAAQALDRGDSALEALIGQLVLNPGAHAARHDGEPIPPEASHAFHRAILKRAHMAEQMHIDAGELASALRARAGLPPRWVDDSTLLAALPLDLLTRLKKALVFITYPDATLPAQPQACTVGRVELARAIAQTRACWADWVDHIRAHHLPVDAPALAFPQAEALAQRCLEAIEARAQLPGTILDALDLCEEDTLAFAARHPAFVDRMRAHAAWPALADALAAREPAMRDVTLSAGALGAALAATHGTPFAALFMPEALAEQLTRSAASCQTSKQPAADFLAHLAAHAPRTAQRIEATQDDLTTRLAALEATLPGTLAHLQALLDAAGTQRIDPRVPRAPVHAEATRVLLCGPDTALDPTALRAHADALDQLRFGSPWAAHTTGTHWLRQLSESARALATRLASLRAKLDTLHFDCAPTLADAMARGALRADTDRRRLARELFACHQALSADTQARLNREAALTLNKIPPTVLSQLAQWRADADPATQALADLFERLASRVRETNRQQNSRAAPPAPDQDTALLDAAVAQVQREQPGIPTTPGPLSGALDRFIAAMPTSGSIAKRQQAVRTYLQSLPPLVLGTLIIDASNWTTARKIPGALAGLQQDRQRGAFFIEQVLPQAQVLLKKIGGDPPMSTFRNIIGEYITDANLAKLYTDVPTDRLITRFTACLDNFASWVLQISQSVPTQQREALLRAAMGGDDPFPPEAADPLWRGQIENLVRLNAGTNFVDLTHEIKRVPFIGDALLDIWHAVLERYSAQFDADSPSSDFFSNGALIEAITLDAMRDFHSQFGASIFLLLAVPEFQLGLQYLMISTGQLAANNGRLNPGALAAYLMGDDLIARIERLSKSELTFTL